MNKDYIEACIDYILVTEKDDYYEWCNENGYEPLDFKNNISHIFAVAVLTQKQLKGE